MLVVLLVLILLLFTGGYRYNQPYLGGGLGLLLLVLLILYATGNLKGIN